MPQSSEPLAASALLQLMWLASPALPVGGFSYSEGLEAAIEAGLIKTEADATAWLRDQLHLGLARSDLAVCAQAFVAWQREDGDYADIAELNDWVTTTRETSEFRQQTQQMARSLADWLRNLDSRDASDSSAAIGARASVDSRIAALKALAPAPTWPIAFALAAVRTGAPRREALLSYAFGWAENMVQAAVKSVPLGQAAGQRVLGALADELPRAVDAAALLGPHDRQAYTPMLAILSAQHEAQYSRLFRS